ncbi:hypothetical protein D3C87_161710 [compost metagenome]
MSLRLVLVALTLVSAFSVAEAKRKNDNDRDNGREGVYDPRDRNNGFRDKHDYPEQREASGDSVDPRAPDRDIVAAVNNQRRVNFVEGSGMVVTKILPDDNSGLKHQKWMVRLSNGKLMQAVYNSDMCPRVPLQVGDVVSMGGMFIWTNEGAMLHWLHHDPRGNRPDGYVGVNGKFYCRD